MLLDEVGRHIMRDEVLEALTPADLCSLAAGLAACGHSPGVVLVEALAARAAQLGGRFSKEQRAALADSFEALGYADKLGARWHASLAR